jgi:hypothetical protein
VMPTIRLIFFKIDFNMNYRPSLLNSTAQKRRDGLNIS